MVPESAPWTIGLRGEEFFQFGFRNERAAFGQHSIGPQLALEEQRLILTVPPDSELATPIRAAPVKNVKLLGIEIDAVNPIFVLEFAGSMWIAREMDPSPIPDLLAHVSRHNELQLGGKFAVLPH